MCGRFASSLPPEAIRALFRTTNPLPNIAPNWNVAPSQPAMVIRRHPETGQRRLDLLRWGLIPSFTKDLKAAPKPINARSETAASSGMFRAALAQRRALIPADVFFEWRTLQTGKQPYAIARRDGAPLAFAGIWEGWRSPEGETARSYAILTTAANGLMSRLHERMPVILEPDDWATWLGEETGVAPALMRPAAETVLHLWPVSRAVNSVRNNGPSCWTELTTPMRRRRAMRLRATTPRRCALPLGLSTCPAACASRRGQNLTFRCPLRMPILSQVEYSSRRGCHEWFCLRH